MQILANFVWLCIHWSNSTLHSFSKTKQKIFSLFCCLFLGEHSEIDVNSKPKKKAVVKDFPCYHWNADCLAAHNLKKKKLIEAYIILITVIGLEPTTIQFIIEHSPLQFDVIFWTNLDYLTSNDDKEISIVRADHSNNTERTGIPIYFIMNR